MSMIVWILVGLVLGLIASKIVSTTGEGTVVHILLGIVGAVIAGWLFAQFNSNGVAGFDIDSVYSAGMAAIGAIVVLALYHAFFRRRMLRGLGEPVSLLEHVTRNPHGVFTLAGRPLDPERCAVE
jgi:uncharacterized membrane protein YeaQ/YmgE (transglycosylase-associated protein family)